VLRIGTAGIFGIPLSLPMLMAQRAGAAGETKPGDEVSFIFLMLKGGLSTIDTWDMKPEAPAEFRGEFTPIPTNVPGIQIGEHTPRVAQHMDKLSFVRSFAHRSSDHGAADHYMLTGYFPTAGFNPGLSPNNQRPSHGSIIARKLGARGTVPPYVCLPKMHPSGGSAYLGPASAPFTIEADPSAPGFAVPDIVPPLEVETRRLASRQELLKHVDRYQRSIEAQANTGAQAINAFRQKAFGLMTSPEAKRAFDLQAEPAALRDEYGRNTLGQSCIMARRLVEAGVRCVTVEHSNWDTHDNNFHVLKTELLPALDLALAALLHDLTARGMLEKTIVLVTGEFGRTPRINKNAGRDHWGPAFSIAVAGGGFQGGRAIGRSDARAERPADPPYGPEDLSATLFHLMGIDPNEEFHTPEGRPVKIANDGRLITELL
jgi:hypothetical protein